MMKTTTTIIWTMPSSLGLSARTVPTWGRRMGLIRMTTSNEPSILSCFSLTASGFQPHPLCFIDANDHPPLRKMQKNSTALPAFSAVVEGGLGRLGSTQMTTVLYSSTVLLTQSYVY
jgi:hypothetical protein